MKIAALFESADLSGIFSRRLFRSGEKVSARVIDTFSTNSDFRSTFTGSKLGCLESSLPHRRAHPA